MSNDTRNQYGLTARDMETLFNLLHKYPEVQVVYVFGSRAKGNYKLGSDIDLAVMNEDVPDTTIYKLKSDCEESNLPYRIDIINFSTLTHNDLIDHIKRVGIPFYVKDDIG